MGFLPNEGSCFGHRPASGGELHLLLFHAKISAPLNKIQKAFDSSDLNKESKCFSCFSDDGCSLWMPKKYVTKRRGG